MNGDMSKMTKTEWWERPSEKKVLLFQVSGVGGRGTGGWEGCPFCNLAIREFHHPVKVWEYAFKERPIRKSACET